MNVVRTITVGIFLVLISIPSQLAHAEPNPPLTGDALMPPPPARMTRAVGNAPDRYSPSAFLAGRVAVQLVFVESTGQYQPSSENWNNNQRTAVTAQVRSALTWWQARLPNARLSFDVVAAEATTGDEPITLTLSDEKLWAGEALTSLGFSGGNYFEQAYSADESLRQQTGADWSTTIFVVNSDADPDGRFADGQFAYAYVGGPFLVITSDAATYGTSNMAPVVAHEFGHIFGALDQYEAAGTPCTVKSGYLAIANTNSQAKGCGTRYQSIMWEPSSAFQAQAVDGSALGQLGYRDSDDDTIPDPLDTAPTLDVTITQAVGKRPQVVAYASDQPFPSPLQRSASINTIARIEFRADNGDWKPLPAADGAYDSLDERVNTQVPLYDGMHTLELRAVNRVGNMSPVVTQQVEVQGVGTQPEISITVPTLQNATATMVEITAPAGFEVRMSEQASFTNAAWQPAQSGQTFTLAAYDGEHVLYIVLRDAQGVETPIWQYKIVVDREAPTGSAVVRNEGGQTLVISAQDATSGIDAMAIANVENTGQWQPYSAIVLLPEHSALSTLRLRDKAGNVSAPLVVQQASTVYLPLASY